MLITTHQIHVGRVSLGWSLARLASVAGVSVNSVVAAERNADCRISTIRNLAEAMEAEGIVFGPGNSVTQRMEWANGKPDDPRVAAASLQILNQLRRRDGKCDFEDE
jgi:hypothetical protein